MKRIVVCFTLLSVLLIACQAAGTPSVGSTGEPSFAPTPARPSPARGYCGDGRCDGPENSQNCPADCAVPGTPSAPSPVAPASTPTQPPAVSTCWAKAIGGPEPDYAPSFQIEEDGYLVVGHSQSFELGGWDAFIVKLDRQGNILQSVVFGGKGNDVPYTIERTADHGYIIAGATDSFGAGGEDLFVAKLQADWSLEWARAIGGPGRDSGFKAVQTEDKGYLVVATTDSFGAGLNDAMLVKLDERGALVFARTIGTPKADGATSLIKTADGGYAIGGHSSASGNANTWVVKLSRDYAVEWARSIGGPGNEGMNWDGLRQTGDGGYLYASGTTSFGAGGARLGDFLAVRLKPDGDLDWATVLGGEGDDAGWTMNETADGYIAGGVFKKGVEIDAGDILLTKLDRDGRLLWARTFNGYGVGLDEIEEIKPIGDGYLLVGVVESRERKTDFFVGKVDKDGFIEGCPNFQTPSVSVVYPRLDSLPVSPTVTEISPTITPVSPEVVSPRPETRTICSSSNALEPAGPVNLTADSPANDQNPAWSPDGERIVFTSGRSGNNELWLMGSDGSAPTALTSNGAENVNLPGRAWCPGNDRIVFASDVESENDEIFSIVSDGSDRQRLTTTDARNWEPSWSPDCRQIVFQSDRSGNWDIWRMNAGGSNPVQLTDDPADDWQPNWSPDGTTIVFQSNRSGNWDIWTMDVNGRSLTNVTGDPAEDTDPSWSPDGRWIVYSSDRSEGDGDIWAIAAGGGTSIPITDNPAYDGAPSWSPDGSRIAFESMRSGNLDIWVVDAPGAHRRCAPAFAWPDWARTARIAGASFELEDSEADIDARLDALAVQNVSVVLADSPWGWSYSAWVDDAEFYAVHDLVTTIVQKAHARGLKVVMYQTGLELTSTPERNPGPEHPDWPQRSLDGQPILFNDISSDQEHWLDEGEWDLWVSPCSSYRQFSLDRVREMVRTGIDGLWVDTVYLQHSIGDHEDLWPSTDPCSVAAFRAATGLDVPTAEDWDNPAWRRWVVWRHGQMADYLLALKEAARQVNPDLVFFEENWAADTSGATCYANDPAEYLAYPDLSTGHEVSTIGDRVDKGETGMEEATLDQWLAFRTMIAFARAADRGKPTWILTYGHRPRDSAQLAGMVLAEGGNFYETQGPEMAGTVGTTYRTQLFGWIAAHENALYGGGSAAQVGLVYSPRNRDLLDSGSGDYYDVQDSTHFAAYRAAANLFYRAHVPFDVVLDTDIAGAQRRCAPFNRYAVLILPEVWGMDDATAAALRAFPGRLITIGDTGQYDEWLNERDDNALAGVPQRHFATVNSALVAAADTGLLSTDAPPEIQMGLRRTPDGYALVLVNTAAAPTDAFTLDLRLTDGVAVMTAHLSTPEGTETDVAFTISGDAHTVHLDMPAGVDTLALLTLTTQMEGAWASELAF